MDDFTSRPEPESSWLEQLASTSREIVAELPTGAELCAGRYLVQHEVGRGGMGIVYAVWDHEREERVALKTLTRSSPHSIFRIKQEFRGLAHVQHPNLVRLHELFEDAGRWCFTLELVPGHALVQGLAGAPRAAVRGALRQLCEGICALHAAGKLHRDLKPSNVLFTPSGRVVILDFGLAQDISAPAGPPSSPGAAGLSGTPGYMAPELISGASASPASDWYSFGVIVWVLLTGRLPWEGRNTPVAERSLPPPDSERMPSDLEPLCRALLSLDPALRPGAAEVRAALGQDPAALGQPAARDPREPRDARLLHGVPPAGRGLIGRERELDWMRQAYEACACGLRPVVLLLSGESGIGKTALVQSFLGERAEALVLRGRCYEREFLPYKAFDAAIDELCRYLLQLPATELDGLLPPDFAALCRLFPVLGRVSEPRAQLEPESEDAHELRRRGFEALAQLLARIHERLPVLLWIDDLQWTDADSTSLLLYLLRQPRAPKILLIASHRSDPGAQHEGLSALYETLASDVRLDVRALELGPLAPEDATALLERVGSGAPRALLQQALEQAHGHPFLLEELSRYAALRPPEPDAWPSLDEAIGARVAALSGPERNMLELLAFAGRPLPEPLARAASGAPWHAALQTLCGSRLAQRSAVDGCVSCYHDAIREAVLSTVSVRRARQCHRALARGLLREAAAQPEHLALHLRGSGHPMRAAEQMALAARRAASTLAFERAAQLYRSALELGRFDASEARRLQLAQAHALSAAGHGNEAAQLYLQVAEGAGGPGGETTQALELRTRAAEQYLLSGRLEQGLELLRAALQPLGVRLPSSALGAIASLTYQRARLRLRGYRFEARPVPEVSARRLLLLQRASAALARLDPLRASELASRALVLALEMGSADAIGAALVADLVVGTLFRVPESELARRRERAERACKSFGAAPEQAQLHSALATAARLKAQPDLPEALRHFERFFEIHQAHVLPRASYERPWEEWARTVVRCLQGELAPVAREVPARLDEGWARGDHCIVPLWAGGDQLLARLAVGDVEAAERDWGRAHRIWSSRTFTLQDLMLALGATHLQRYRANARAAWQIAEAARQRLQTSPLRRMPNAVDAIQSMRGHAALELAAQTQSASERQQLLQLARRLQRPPLRQPHLPAIFRGHLLDAAWHFQMGDVERAALLLGRAEPSLESIPLYAHAVRYRRGLLLGGDEGAQLRATGQRFLSTAGAVDPERLLDLLLPGYGPSSSHTPRPPASERRTRG